MSLNTRLTRYEYICLHVSVIMSAVVLVSSLSSVNNSTTLASITTTSPQLTQTTENVTEAPSTQSSSEATSSSGNDTTAATTTLQSGSTEETTTTQPGGTSQSTTSLSTTTITTTTNSSDTTPSPETQSTTNTMTSETTLTSVAIPTTTVNTTEETETTTTSDTITTEKPNNGTNSTSEGVDNTTSTEAPTTATNSSAPDTTTQTSTESTEATSTILTNAPNQNTTQGPSDTTSSVSITTTTTTTTTETSDVSTETPDTHSTEVTSQTTTTQQSDNTSSVSDTTTEAPSTHSTETNNQTTATTSVDNTTITQPTTAAITTAQPTTTTVTTTTTKSYQIMPVYPDTENAVLEFTFELRFTDCTFNKTTIENKLSVVSNSVDGCEYIRVKSIKSCPKGRRKRSASTPKVSVDTVFGVDAQKGASSGSNVSDALYSTLSTVDNIDVNYLNETKDNFTGALTSKQICDSDVCTSALIGRPGFVCVTEPYGNNTQRCAIMYYCDHQSIDCGKHGHCYVETEIQSERVSYSSKCRCTDEEFFRYEGTHCTERVMTWELAVIICASAFGAFILVLLFIIIVMCCRNASNSADVSFEDSELIYTPSGIASANGRNGRDASKGVENQGYMEVRDTSGSWKPEASANTYAHIESKLREHNYDMQIKRPQVTQFRKSDEITEF